MRAVLFDFYGTLAFASRWGATYDEVLARHGLVLTDDARLRWRQEVYDGQDHRLHSRSRSHYQRWEQERLRRLALACGCPDADEVVADLHRASKDFVMQAYPEAAEVLAAVRASGRIVAVCSNWGWDLDQAMDQCGLTPLVDVVVTSAQAGTRKPHPQIFEHTLERCGVKAGEALFVGDTWSPDVEGPIDIGMQAVHLVRDERPFEPGRDTAGDLEGSTLPAGAFRVRDLTPVVDMLAS